MSFFKGYVRTRNKKCLEKFKGVGNLKKLEDVQGYTEYAGILAPETVLIDVDDNIQSEKLLNVVKAKEIKCQVRKTTRGMHFFFKNNGDFEKCYTGAVLAIGIQADIKAGVKNSYSILKFDGKERPIIYDTKEYQEVPKWLTVINSTVDLINMNEGEGRNSKLFSHILTLQDAGLNKEQCIETLDIINKYVFDKPLSDDEFKTITRDDAFKANLETNFFGKRKEFLFDKFANHMMDLLNIKRINNQLHVYVDGTYLDGVHRIEAKMIEVIPKLSRAQRKEALDYIELLAHDDTKQADAKYIAFRNGILDIETGDLLPFSPDFIITNKIDYDYDPLAQSELVDRTLDKLACGKSDIRALLEECAGYCFYRRNELRKAFILTGDKSNGKSTYIAMLQKMLGDDNTSALDLKELGDRFKTSEIYRKLANLGDDIGDEFITDMSIFKKLVTGDRVTAERKGQDPFSFNSYAKLIFSANNLPRTKDRTGAIIDRLIVVPFNATFSKNDPDYDPYIKYKLVQDDCIQYLIKLGIEGLKRVLERKAFTESEKVNEELDNYNKLNNPILYFFADISVEDLIREPVDVWFAKYHDFCLGENINTLSKIEFSRQLLRHFNGLEIKVKSINGKRYRMFCLKKIT